MKARLNLLSLLFLILLFLSSCQDTANKSFTTSITVHETWAEFQKQKDAASCKKFINSIENFEPEKFNSYPILKSQTNNQMKSCIETAQSLLEILETEPVPDEKVVSEKIEQINLCLLAYLRNQNFALQDTQQNYFSFFIWLLATIIIGGLILIYLNIREIKKKDQIIYNSEQFLKHSMEVQEAERRRISRELHDTVAQSMRYVSLLAEGLLDKDAASKIITTQNENIESIRKLCYNLTPPGISANDMVSALELLGQKIFDSAEQDFQFRIVVDDSADFSDFSDEQLMNIYRIVQEAFQNIKKHAKANEVTVLFKNRSAEETGLKIIITDDGCGMSATLVEEINSGVFKGTENSHFGVRNIFERVQLLGGNVTYRSEPDCGTQITVVI